MSFSEIAQQYRLPLREHFPVLYYSSFYGQWDGETHPEQVSIENLIQVFETELDDGFTEISCHPGYVDEYFTSGYHHEREMELKTLCDPAVREKIIELDIRLINFAEYNQIVSKNI